MSKIVLYPANGYDFDAADVAAYLAGLTSGVFSSAEDFPVTAAGGLKVTVGAGRGWVHPSRFTGYSITKRESDTLTMPLADPSLPRIDRIVMRYDAGARAASLQVLQGTASSTPTAPAISRTELIYDLCLAEIARPAGSTSITTGQITDTRLDEKLCGIVRDGVTGIPTDELLAAAKARINALEEKATSSAAAAKDSEDAAALSETHAAASEKNAKASETAAKQALQDTQTEHTTALQDIARARTTALNDVAASTKTATTAANTATQQATAAAGSATQAAGSASAAEKSKTAAAMSERNAAKHEEAAKKYSDEAGAKASTDKTLRVEDAPADAAATGAALDKKANKDVILDEDGNVIFYSKAAVDKLLAGKLSLSGGTMIGPLILPGGSALGIEDNAATHNMVYRGKALGTSVTSEQWAAIKAGTFKDLYLGDYWSIGGVDYLIAAFNYWLTCGDTACNTNHLLVVPRNNLYDYKFNPTNTTEGGYVGSDLYKNGLTQAKTTINSAFGSAHILSHRQFLVNAVTNGKPTGSDWYDSTVVLMNENMVYA